MCPCLSSLNTKERFAEPSGRSDEATKPQTRELENQMAGSIPQSKKLKMIFPQKGSNHNLIPSMGGVFAGFDNGHGKTH